MRKRLEPLMRSTAPTAKPLRKKDTVWVEPKLSARIEFRAATEDGMLRHPSFKGWCLNRPRIRPSWSD